MIPRCSRTAIATSSASGWPGFGVVPWLAECARLPSEDAVVLERRQALASGRLLIACLVTPRISNFDDLDPLKLEPGIELAMISPGQPIPVEAALIAAGLQGDHRRSCRDPARRLGH